MLYGGVMMCVMCCAIYQGQGIDVATSRHGDVVEDVSSGIERFDVQLPLRHLDEKAVPAGQRNNEEKRVKGGIE